jgi:ribosome-associated protein
MTDIDIPEQILNIVTTALEDMKAVDIKILDVRTRASFTDYMVITSGTSTRHVKSIASEVEEKTKAAGFRAIGVEGYTYGEWTLVDLGEVVVHVMIPTMREFYQLEKLWAPE